MRRGGSKNWLREKKGAETDIHTLNWKHPGKFHQSSIREDDLKEQILTKQGDTLIKSPPLKS